MAHDPAGAAADAAAARLAEELERRSMGTAARLLADAHRPLAPLLSDVGAAVGPLIGALGGGAAGRLRALVEDPRGLERFVAALDARRHDAEPR